VLQKGLRKELRGKLDARRLDVDHRENNTNNLSKTSRLLLPNNNHPRNAPSRKSSARTDDKKQEMKSSVNLTCHAFLGVSP
jgi:hypothetical protein